jgi:WD40 repeat protein
MVSVMVRVIVIDLLQKSKYKQAILVGSLIVSVFMLAMLIAVILIRPLSALPESTKPYQTWTIGNPVDVVRFNPNGQIMALGTGSGDVQVRNVNDGTLRWNSNEQMNAVLSLEFSPDGQTLASGSSQGEIQLWRANDGSHIRTLPAGEKGWGIDALDFSLDGQVLASGGRDGKVRLWRIADGQLTGTLSDNVNRAGSPPFIDYVNFDAGGNLAAATDKDTVLQWRLSDGKLVKTEEGYARKDTWNDARNIVLNADNSVVAANYRGIPEIYVWYFEDGHRLFKLEGQHAWSLAFSPDGQLLATGGGDSEVDPALPSLFPEKPPIIIIWRMSDGKEQATFSGHTDNIMSLDWSPDGQLLISGSDDGTVRLWQTK